MHRLVRAEEATTTAPVSQATILESTEAREAFATSCFASVPAPLGKAELETTTAPVSQATTFPSKEA
jgi:hypothetical protein